MTTKHILTYDIDKYIPSVIRRMAPGISRRKDDDGASGPPHAPLRDYRDRQQQLPPASTTKSKRGRIEKVLNIERNFFSPKVAYFSMPILATFYMPIDIITSFSAISRSISLRTAALAHIRATKRIKSM